MDQKKFVTALTGLLFSVVFLMNPVFVYAGSDGFNVQGRLVTTAGNPINGTQSVHFKIQRVPAGGSVADLWEETQSVVFQNGIYSVTLGSPSKPLTNAAGSIFKTSDPLQLVITIQNEVFPAIPIQPTPLAFRAELLGDKSEDDLVVKPTGLASGDILYHDGSDFQRLSLGNAGQILTVNSGKPTWTDMPDAVLKADFAGAGHLLVGNGAGGCNSLAPGSTGQVLASNGSGVYWKTSVDPIPAAVLTADGSLIIQSGGPKELPIGPAGHVLTSESGIPQWKALPNFLSESVFTSNSGAMLYKDSTGIQNLSVGTAGQVLGSDGSKPVWQDLPSSTTPTKVYAHYEATANSFGIIQWQPKQTSATDFTLLSYESTANAAIRFNKTGRYFVTFQFMINPNYNWNEVLFLPTNIQSTHSNNAVFGTMTHTDGSFNIVVSQSASTIIHINSVSTNNVFRMVSNGWGGPGIYNNKAFGNIVIIKID